jgi:hypothetical protein
MCGSIGPCIPHELLCAAQGLAVFPMGDVSKRWSRCDGPAFPRCNYGVATSRRSGVEYGTYILVDALKQVEALSIDLFLWFSLSMPMFSSFLVPNSFDFRLGIASSACL